MRIISKICLGLIAAFSLSACNRGSKVSEEKFFEEVAKIENVSYKKATITYSYTSKEKDNFDNSEQKNTSEGTFTKNELGEWERSEDTSYGVETRFLRFALYLHLNVLAKSKELESNSSDAETKYYIKPFSYDCSYTEETYTEETKTDYLNSNLRKELINFAAADDYYKNKRTTTIHYEWNDFGFITYAECKHEYPNNEKSNFSETSKIKISYK